MPRGSRSTPASTRPRRRCSRTSWPTTRRSSASYAPTPTRPRTSITTPARTTSSSGSWRSTRRWRGCSARSWRARPQPAPASTTVSKKVGNSWGTLAPSTYAQPRERPRPAFHAYVERLTTGLGHRDRHGPLRDYVTGLCLPGERKSVEPMAARVDPRHVRARHQSMHHFIANAAWDDRAVLRVARETVLAALARHGPVAAWVVDDTGMPKKGRHSVGVARQYCGVLGKEENCQVAVSVSVAHERASVPVAYRLYLPETWAQDRP